MKASKLKPRGTQFSVEPLPPMKAMKPFLDKWKQPTKEWPEPHMPTWTAWQPTDKAAKAELRALRKAAVRLFQLYGLDSNVVLVHNEALPPSQRWTERAIDMVAQEYLDRCLDHYRDPDLIWRPEPKPTREERLEAIREKLEAETARTEVPKVMEALGVGYERAYKIVRYGTSKADQIEKLVATFPGSRPDQWSLERKAPGRKPAPTGETVLALNLPGHSLYDYIKFNEYLAPTVPSIRWLRDYYRGNVKKRHLETFDELRRLVPASISDDDLYRSWSFYMVWRARRVTEAILDHGCVWDR